MPLSPMFNTQIKKNSSEKQEAILYFVENENMKKENRVITDTNKHIEGVIVEGLTENSKNMNTLIPSTTKIIDIEIIDKTAFVNFAREGLHGSSTEEYFTILRITDTLFEFDNIDEIQFLVDGEKTETLMGHFDISETFKRN